MNSFQIAPQSALRVLITCVVPPALASDAVGGLIRVMRDRCASARVAGLMVFDGGQVIHLLEGGQPAVERIAAGLLDDTRFDERVLRWRVAPVEGVLPERFQLVYPGEDDQGGEGLLDPVFACEGQAAFDALLEVLPRLDHNGGVRAFGGQDSP